MPGCGGSTALSGSQAIVSWVSQTRALALWAPSDRSASQMNPPKQSARASTPGPSMVLLRAVLAAGQILCCRV
jgi:hypothetical protein